MKFSKFLISLGFIIPLVLMGQIGLQNPGFVGQLNVATAAGGGTSPTTNNLMAWYDFDNTGNAGTNDSHTVGPYNLIETNSPSYLTDGSITYGEADNQGATHLLWWTDDLDNVWHDTERDTSFVIRFRPRATIASGQWPLHGNNGQSGIRYDTTSGNDFRGRIAQQYMDSTNEVATLGVWYNMVCTFEAAGNNYKFYVNGTLEGSTNATPAFNAFFIKIGGSGTGAACDADIDYAGFFNEELSADEVTWLYNSGSTRTYSDL